MMKRFLLLHSFIPTSTSWLFASKLAEEFVTMPTTPHSHAAESHLKAAHAHEAAAASHGMNDHLRAHEQSRLAAERSVEAHKLSAHIAEQEAEIVK